jgi:hypothetical protein
MTMTDPDKESDKKDSSENDKDTGNTESKTTREPVTRGRTFGAPGHEKRG